MKNIPFVKYTSCGNNFVIVDEIGNEKFSEKEKKSFAYYATNPCFGIGSDNLLIVQECKPDTLKSINNSFEYWQNTPDAERVDFIFRMFEPNGDEAYSCGNGLLCIMNYLNWRYRLKSACIMTEIPSTVPNILNIGIHPDSGWTWVNMGKPKRIPQEMLNYSLITTHIDESINLIELEITCRDHDLEPFSNDKILLLTGYLVFTGEPHLVIFPDDNASLMHMGNIFFISPMLDTHGMKKNERRSSFGSWLLHHIGYFLNTHYEHLFSKGINVNFVHIDRDSGNIEYRCFERGIDRETLACGTGAIAVAYVAKQLNKVKQKKIRMIPYRCFWYDPEAVLVIEDTDDGWRLSGRPKLIIQGSFSQDQYGEEESQNNKPAKAVNSTILLIEDNPLDAKLVQAYLKPLNCHIINAATGEKAFLVINKIKFDLIILDVMLPDINGYEICSRLKNSPATRNIPIIFSTSLRDMESKIAGIEQDADCFLVKPLDRRELMAQAQALIKRKKQLDKITSNYENMMNLGSDHGGHLVFKN